MTLKSGPLRAVALSLLLGTAAACARPVPRAARRTLSPDSAAALRAAIRMARPAYATQEEALRAGVYAVPAPVLAVAPTPAPAPAPTRTASGRTAPADESPARVFLIQIAAFRDSASAEASASEARRLFPHLRAEVRPEPPLFRVALAGWPDSLAAEDALVRVREVYPSAWVRRPVP